MFITLLLIVGKYRKNWDHYNLLRLVILYS